MSVWLCIPSKRPTQEANATLAHWHAQGYRIALWLDPDEPHGKLYDRFLVGPYPGYAKAVNLLICDIAQADRDARWFVCAGDDTLPDPTKRADEIATECEAFFRHLTVGQQHKGETFGVMQPTGDRWGDRKGAYIDRVAGSPWIGRDFALKMYQGNGPYWPEYKHMFVDQEIRDVALMMGVYLERLDVTQHHNHWGRNGFASDMPEFLKEANSADHWNEAKRIYTARAMAGFPGSEPLG